MTDCKYCQDEICPVADVPGVCRFEEREVKMAEIKDYLPDAEILAQLAEEASELAQAALKLRRVLDGTNPTPATKDQAMANLVEEYSDVVCCMMELEVIYDLSLINKKKERWIKRLSAKRMEEAQNAKQP